MRIPYITTPTGLGQTADRLATGVNDVTTVATMLVGTAGLLSSMAFHTLEALISGRSHQPVSSDTDFHRLTDAEKESVRRDCRKGFV